MAIRAFVEFPAELLEKRILEAISDYKELRCAGCQAEDAIICLVESKSQSLSSSRSRMTVAKHSGVGRIMRHLCLVEKGFQGRDRNKLSLRSISSGSSSLHVLISDNDVKSP